jgi:hypothetical protein
MVQILKLQTDSGITIVRLYEIVNVQWIPPVIPLSPAAIAARKQRPEAFRPMLIRGPHGEVTSQFGNRHEVTLLKGSSGWRIVKDAYDEEHLYAASPDLVPGSWPAVPKGGGTRGIVLPPGSASPLTVTGGTYNRDWAVQCASSNWRIYNYQFCDYRPCGGDCANFVSQCFIAGGEQESDADHGHGPWRTYTNGACGTCGTSATYAGSDPWANNQYLRDWYFYDGRSTPVSTVGELANGDIINYQWCCSCHDPGFDVDHVTIVVDAANGPLIASHAPDLYGSYWNFPSCGQLANYTTYTALHDTF